MKLKPTKCHFVKEKVEYLGHLVSAKGLEPNPDKVRIVQEFPRPQSTTDVRSFLGIATYYRRFIPHFAQIAAPLNKLTSKNVKFFWDTDCQIAFDTLKQKLMSAPVLAYPDFELPFHLYVDAGQESLGLTLGQIVDGQEVVIAYAGRGLNKAERNYSSCEREALAVIEGIKKFRVYLYDRHFKIHTDNSAVRWLMSIQDLAGRLALWSLLLQPFDFEIIHRPEKSNGNADALSHRPYTTCRFDDALIANLTTTNIKLTAGRFITSSHDTVS